MKGIRFISSVPARCDGVTLCPLEDEALLYDTNRRKIFVVNATAALVWQLCDGEISIERIERKLRSRFADTDSDVASDIREILGSFERHGLVTKESR